MRRRLSACAEPRCALRSSRAARHNKERRRGTPLQRAAPFGTVRSVHRNGWGASSRRHLRIGPVPSATRLASLLLSDAPLSLATSRRLPGLGRLGFVCDARAGGGGGGIRRPCCGGPQAGPPGTNQASGGGDGGGGRRPPNSTRRRCRVDRCRKSTRQRRRGGGGIWGAGISSSRPTPGPPGPSGGMQARTARRASATTERMGGHTTAGPPKAGGTAAVPAAGRPIQGRQAAATRHSPSPRAAAQSAAAGQAGQAGPRTGFS